MQAPCATSLPNRVERIRAINKPLQQAGFSCKLQLSHPVFGRLALALAELCHLVYLRSQDDLGSQPHFNVPVQSPHGLAQEHSVEASLHHFR